MSKGDAFRRLGADIKRCALCRAHFRVCEHQHRVWGKAVVPSGMHIASVTGDEARITMSFNNPDTGVVTAYFYTLYCSNHCAWWHSQHFRALPDVARVQGRLLACGALEGAGASASPDVRHGHGLILRRSSQW